ncbi:hypothetical protein KC19_11G096500 [Ceratodon purpureus]|uniref:GPI ethanolamine phosphate transferase 3 n=1 Tax=Ceratodon purpureus TaxID=3225 RepID=A0A8T0GEA9_CERPU|nr:hypothetical protein KC19_11G096500 [Ceratodon purpureus]
MMEGDARCRLVALFCYILCLHSLAIFFFTSGFLLTRTELPEFSTCSDIAKSPCFGETMDFSGTVSSEKVTGNCDDIVGDKAFCSQNGTIPEPTGGGGSEDKLSKECWTKPAIKRAVIIIIDALRFDFVAPSSSFPGESQPWMDKLQVLQQLSREENCSARIFKFVADPPTTTLQRLKGLTTGGLPTFVDIGHSFGAPAIVEDNLINQLVRAGKKVRMMGDDTWMKLFPSHFSVAHPFDSFNVKDLHTVDDGVIREIFPALLETDWNVLIGHFLGVDHVGHIFGVESPLMVEKLEQYNRVIEEIVAVLKNQSGPGGLHEDTMLLVLGDHGQTLNGDHGGGTSEEVETALFALSMRESPGRLPLDLQSSTCTISTEVKAGRSQCITTFPQLDFASTMAALLGVPFPFGSVGRVNTELYALAASTWPLPSEVGHLSEALVPVWLERFNHVLCMNSWQVKRYLDAYTASSIRGFPSAEFAHVQSLYDKAQTSPHFLHTDHPRLKRNDSGSDLSKFNEYSSETVTRLIDSIQSNLVYLLAAADLARTQWTQFEDEWMVIGLILLVTSMVIHGVALSRAMRLTQRILLSEDRDSEVQNRLHELFPLRRMLLACGGVAVTAGVIWGLQMTIRWLKSPLAAAISHGQTNIIITALILIASVVAYVMPIYGVGQVQSDQSVLGRGQTIGTSSQDQWTCVKSYMAVLSVGLHACGLLSNSYILSEGQVVCFLLATSGILYLRQAIQSGCKVPQAILFLILNAGMASVGLFEIFKDPATIASSSLIDDYVPASYSLQQFVTLACAALITTVLPLFSLARLILRRARTILRLQSLYWATAVTIPLAYSLLVIHWFTMDLVSSMVVEIPQSVKEFSRLLCPQLVYLVSLMLLIFTIISMTLNARGNVSTSYRDHLVEGIVSMLAGISGTIILLLGRKGPTIVLLAVLEVWCLLDLQGVEDLNQRKKEADKGLDHQDEHLNGRSLGSYFGAAVDWNLVAVQLFFCTGHRCTFDGLHYTAAFVGFDEFYFYRQGALLAADTFGSSHILPVIGLPLLVTAAAVAQSNPSFSDGSFFSLEVAKVYLCYGLVRTILTAVTTVCVTLQRRHLMVWGLFAPKYVFDALGLLVIDGFIVIAAIFYFSLFSRKARLKMQ